MSHTIWTLVCKPAQRMLVADTPEMLVADTPERADASDRGATCAVDRCLKARTAAW